MPSTLRWWVAGHCGAASLCAARVSRFRGLELFGRGDETERLRLVARQSRFREAVTWQNPAALVNAVVNVADNAPTKLSRARGREDIVVGYFLRNK